MSAEAAAGLLALRVLTPEGPVLEGDVFEVSLPGSEGELGILPAHAAILARLSPGAMAYRAPEGSGVLALGRGVAEVTEDRVTVLVDRAVSQEDIDAAALQETRRKLDAELQGAGLTEERIAQLEEELLLIEVQLRVAGKGEAAH